MSTAKSTKAKPVCHTWRTRMGRMFYDDRREDRSQPRVPWLQLRAHWLEQAGFAIDTPVSVRVMNGCLVLIAADDKAG